MKSQTMMPPMSLSRSCRAISRVASRLVFRIVPFGILLSLVPSRVDVDRYERLSGLDDDISARTEDRLLLECRLKFLLDSVFVEERLGALVEPDTILELRSDALYVLADLIVDPPYRPP